MIQEIIATLRVNIKSLAAEAVIIRKQTHSTKNVAIKNSLYLHRVGPLRTEARHAQLALAAIRGKDYKLIEKNAQSQPNWKKIYQKIERHTKNEQILTRVKKWCEDSKASFGV